MAARKQFIGHAKSIADQFIGLIREVTLDTTNFTLRVHDGATPGGIEAARKDLANVSSATNVSDGKMTKELVQTIETFQTEIDDLQTLTGEHVVTIANHETRLDTAEPEIDALQVTVAEHVALLATLGDLAFLDVVDTAQIADRAVGLNELALGTASRILRTSGIGVPFWDPETIEIPDGTKMIFCESAAPDGWEIVTGLNDKTIIIDDGGSAGTTAGSWTISGLTVGGTAITIAQMPEHVHPAEVENAEYVTTVPGTGADDGFALVGSGRTTHLVDETGSAGEGETHTHTLTSDAVWRPAHLKVIVAQRAI